MICMYMKIRAYPTFYNLIKTNSDCVVAMHIIINLIHLGSFAILIEEFHKKKRFWIRMERPFIAKINSYNLELDNLIGNLSQ